MEVRISIVALIIMLFFTPSTPAQEEDTVENPAVVEAIRVFRSGDAEEAIRQLEAVLAAAPNDDDALNALGIIYSQTEQSDKALEYFNRAIAAKERNFKAIFNKLNLLIGMQQIDEAEALLVDMANTYPDYSNAWVNLSALQMQLGKLDEALVNIEKAIALDNSDFDAHFKRGQILLLKRQYAEAQSAFERTLELSPQFPSAKRGLTIVKDIREKLDAGYYRVRQIVVKTPEMARDIMEKLKAGEQSFGELAARHSIDATAKSGGNLGFIKRGDLIPALEEVIFSLEPGQVSTIIRSPLGFHIFLREE